MKPQTRLSRIREWIERTECGVPPVLELSEANRLEFRCPACNSVVVAP